MKQSPVKSMFGGIAILSVFLACSTVTEPAGSQPDGLVMLGRALTLTIGDSTSIGLTLTQGLDVVERTAATGTGPSWRDVPPTAWRSSDTNVATVRADGLVTARREGSAWILASRAL